MIVVIAAWPASRRSGPSSLSSASNAAMIMFGLEHGDSQRRPCPTSMLHYIFGCFAGAVPWLVIFVTILVSARSRLGAHPRLRDRDLRFALCRVQRLRH